MKTRKKALKKAAKSARIGKKRSASGSALKPQIISGIKVPAMMQPVSVYLNVKDVDATIAFYEKAFGFKKKLVMPGPDGKSMHGELMHGNCTVMVGRPSPESGIKTPSDLGGTPASTYVYVKDVDALAKRARAAGAQITREPTDQFWGDRMCAITDPEGHNWGFATVKRIVPPSEMHPPGGG